MNWKAWLLLVGAAEVELRLFDVGESARLLLLERDCRWHGSLLVCLVICEEALLLKA